jgi:8-oxo-dGTP diphosphatase
MPDGRGPADPDTGALADAAATTLIGPAIRIVPASSSPPIRVVAAVVRRGERVLVCLRPPHKRHGGLWEFPGGKIEPGESDLEAARRELGEELGVDVLSVGPAEFSMADPGSAFVIEFMPVEIAGEPLCLEHERLEWVLSSELDRLPLAPSDREYARRLARGPGRDVGPHGPRQPCDPSA